MSLKGDERRQEFIETIATSTVDATVAATEVVVDVAEATADVAIEMVDAIGDVLASLFN